MPERLQKYLARCGVASRRRCEDLMREGRVTVDGAVVREPGAKIEPGEQTVCFNGQEVTPESHVYYVLHKPPGYVCSSSDPQGRPLAIDLLPEVSQRVYTVGRLDADSEGLILVTNDGAFAHALSHPRHEIQKRYELALSSRLERSEVSRWRSGILSDGELLKVLDITFVKTGRSGIIYDVLLGEGRNRHLRRMAEAAGVTVLRLKRTAIGPLSLGGLKRGEFRALTGRERSRFLDGASPRYQHR